MSTREIPKDRKCWNCNKILKPIKKDWPSRKLCIPCWIKEKKEEENYSKVTQKSESEFDSNSG
jgi:hypothetical protein